VTVLRILAEVLGQALTELVRQPDRTLLRPAGVSHTEGRREAFVAAGQRTGPQAVSSERVFAPWAAPCFFRPLWYA
jgi:hypothetical protein